MTREGLPGGSSNSRHGSGSGGGGVGRFLGSTGFMTFLDGGRRVKWRLEDLQ